MGGATNVKWLERDWMRDPGELVWPFYGWLRERHQAAVYELDAARDQEGAIRARFAAEDQDAAAAVTAEIEQQKAEIAGALREGGKPPEERPVSEPAVATGPLRRSLELEAAAEATAEAEVAVHRATAEVLVSLPLFVYELDVAHEDTARRLRAEYVAAEEPRRQEELERRKRFQSEQVTNGSAHDRCEHCSTEPRWLHEVTWNDRSLNTHAALVRNWLLGHANYVDAERGRANLRPPIGPLMQTLAEVRRACPEVASYAAPEPVLERPDGAPALDDGDGFTDRLACALGEQEVVHVH